ncbi:translocation/assembly module TamB domain-containing protein [Neolewinella agarilytica]|uniref:translocation/assembly module TamB domain-containing protein n=1 Tax=Neolewinella agarilytica TaxID=478744 RepID=UPI002357EB38|nr:translocation/assembly module TamB domain-containing protein [Neolewinella agarilytica]
MAKSLPAKIFKVFLWVIGILLGILLLVFLLLQVPAVQQRLAREIEKVARESLGTDLGIGALDIDFPSRLEIDNFYLNNPAGDSIARVGHLGVGINMLGLLKSRVEVTDLVLQDLFANIRTTDSTSNIDFLLQLGAVDSSAVDSSQLVVQDTTTTSAPWVIDAAGAELLLERADIYYQDDPTGILADLSARRLAGQVNALDLEGQIYDIDYLELEGADALVGIGSSSAPVDTSATAAAMQLLAGRVTIQETDFALKMEGMDIATRLPYVNLEGADLRLGEEMAFNGEVFQLRDLALKLDTPAPKLTGPGMDYNHLDLSDIQAEATDIAYIIDSLHLRLRQLAVKEKSGLTLERSEGTVIYNPTFLGLENFLLRTPNTEIKSDNTALNYDFAAGNMADLLARLQLDGYLGLKDVALLAPDLSAIPVIGNNLSQQLSFSIRANGTMAAMQLSRVQLDGPGVKVRAFGRVENALDVDKIAGRLTLREFSLIPGPLLPLVPDGMLPPDIDWPEKVVAEGSAEYRGDRLQMNFYAVENRQFGNGLLSRVKTNGVIEGVTTFPQTRLNVELDTLMATRATILAYVPPGSLPEDYRIPDFLRGSGTVSGPMESLDVNLRLNLPGEQTFASIRGNIRNALDPDKLNLDVEVSGLAVNIADVREILPDSTLPADLNIPDLKIRNARISGNLTNLDFDVPLETDNGIWNLKGKYNPEDLNINLDLKDIRIAELFTGPMRDTLETLDLGALNITAQVKGRLEPAMNLLVDAAISNEAVGEIVDFNALVEDGQYAADFNITHPEALASGQGSYVLGPDSVASVEALVDINRLNLQHWDITEVPMLVDGRLAANSEGLDPYRMIAYARLDSIRLRGAEGSSYVDSLVMRASLQDFKNEVYVRSDVLDAELLGTFDPVKTPQKMLQFIMAYWDESLRQPTPVENGEEMDFVFELKRPQPLTGGLINGLTELSPFKMSLLYRDASPELLINFDLAEIGYAGLSAKDLAFRTVGDTVSVGFEANWSNISYNDQIELGKTVLRGESVNDELLVELKLYTDTDSLRHYLGFVTDPESDTISIRMEEEQILNFETWTVPASNLIMLAGPSLLIQNFALRNGEQSLSAETTEPGDVVITFGDFNLRTPSRLLFSEEEVAAGIVNGTVGLDNALTNLGIQSNLSVDQLKWSGTLLGDIVAEVSSDNEQTYSVDIAIEEAGNNAALTGAVELNGPIDLLLDVKKLQLASAEPFSLGYLTGGEGYLMGRVDIGGAIEAPTLNGDLSFRDASLVISLLGERFRLDEKPLTFRGQTISFGNDWRVYDSEGGAAQVQGEVVMQSLNDVLLDLEVNAEGFLAINSTLKDNKDWYGKMFVDAEVKIGGRAVLPVVEVNATTSKESELTYIYRIAQQGLVESEGVIDYVEQYRWRDVIRRDTLQSDTTLTEVVGMDLTLDLKVDPNLEVTVVVDPISGQTFVGKANGDLTMRIYPDGRQEAVGRVELTEGEYDFIYQNIINKKFEVLAGSNVTFTGDLLNPQLDLQIRHLAKTSPLALVQGVQGESADLTSLRRSQTFYVDITLKGNLEASNITTDVLYPEDAYGNLGLSTVESSLATLRQDQSRMTTTAFQLLAFGSFNIPLLDSGSGSSSLAATTLTNVMSNYLNNFADQLVGFVDLDFGLNSYEDEGGATQTNLRISLRKALFDERVIISVDGVAGTSADEVAGTQQTYLDNITAEYLINEDGTFRLKFFNDRDRSSLVGGNVIRFGGRLTFGKDFGKLRWFGRDSKGKD